jgi:hypothetical protein
LRARSFALPLLAALPLACQALLSIDDTERVRTDQGCADRDCASAGEAPAASAPGDGGNASGSTGELGAAGNAPRAEDAGAGGAAASPPPEGGASGQAGAASTEEAVTSSLQRVPKVRFPWPSRLLSVCFRDVDAPDAPELARRLPLRRKVRELVDGTWGRFSGLDFYGFQSCDPAPLTLQVELTAAAASHSDVGFADTWVPRVITLDVAASDAEILYWFGRALGLEHELGRSANYEPCTPCDSKAACVDAARPQCLPSGFCGEPFDHASIMSAPSCAGVEPTRRFSAWDVMAIQRAYGRKPHGSLVEIGGRCLEVRGGTAAAGSVVDTYACVRQLPNNSWSFAAEPGRASSSLRVRFDDEARCADAIDAPLSSGPIGLISQPCDPERQGQNARLGPLQLRALGGMCVVAASARSGARLHIRSCPEPSQDLDLWLPAGDRLELAGTGLCAAAAGSPPQLGQRLELRACDGDPTQAFRLNDAEIHYLNPQGAGLCWNVLGGAPSPGAELGLWDGCGLQVENSVFYGTGPLLVRDGCVEALDEPGLVSRRVGVTSCAATAAQAWDWHW